MMHRRCFIAAAGAAGFLAGMAGAQGFGLPGAEERLTDVLPADHPLQGAWAMWKAAFLSPDGRVVDTFQGQSSHSEGQGYGLVLATCFGDNEAADRIIRWTEQNLNVRGDHLLVWRWQPNTTPHVTDRNNASDGDLFYAWGLLRAAELGDARPRRERAMRILYEVQRQCVVGNPDGSGELVLLPGSNGFVHPEGIVINPSYYMPRAMRELGLYFDMPQLVQLAENGRSLIERLASHGPVPDWVMLTPAGLQQAPKPFSVQSGYEAMRVPLFALWSGDRMSEAVCGYSASLMAAGMQDGTPTVLDPATGLAQERSPHPGYAALVALADCACTEGVGATMPVFSTAQPYYPATLHLMALVIQATTYPRCVPI